jgi:hypothetical protein
MERFDAATIASVARLGPAQLRTLADAVERGSLSLTGDLAPFSKEVLAIRDALVDEGDLSSRCVAAYLRGAAAAFAHQEAAVRGESV